MRSSRPLFAGFIAVLLATTSALAAPADTKKGTPKAPPGEVVRYFQFSGELLGDLPLDGFLKEVRQGGRVVSAVLDVCHWTTMTDSAKERFVIPLKAEGNKLTGQGQSQEKKTPVSVNLNRRQTGQTVAFDGTIARGNDKVSVVSNDNSDISESDFLDSQTTEDSIDAAPSDFTELSPGSLGIKIKREQLPALVKELRAANVKLMLDSLAADCGSLRSGEQVVHVDVDPERASALVAKFKTWPGATSVGWVNGGYSIDRAVRIAAAGLRAGNGLDRAKLSAALGAAMAKYYEAKFDTATWDPATAELSLKLKRPSRIVPNLGLTDTIEVMMLVGPESPTTKDWLVVRVGSTNFDTVDDGPEPRLQFSKATSDEDSGSNGDDESMIKALAEELKGTVWNADSGEWQ